MSRRARIERLLASRRGRQPVPPAGPGVGGRSRVGRRVPRGLRVGPEWVRGVVVGYLVGFFVARGLWGLLATFVVVGVLVHVVATVALSYVLSREAQVFRRTEDEGGSGDR